MVKKKNVFLGWGVLNPEGCDDGCYLSFALQASLFPQPSINFLCNETERWVEKARKGRTETPAPTHCPSKQCVHFICMWLLRGTITILLDIK